MKFLHPAAIALCALPLAAPAVGSTSPATPRPFTATYQVLRKGSPLGVSTLTLRRNADGTWTYRSQLDAKSGVAAMLGGHIDEASRFRRHDNRIELVSYDYHMHVTFKNRQRHISVDWKTNTVSVHGHDGDFHYAAQPGLVERHLVVLALGQAVADGQTNITLPVAVKDRVETQTFAVRGAASVTVPAGTFQAVRVDRTHDNKGYAVWYDPARFGTAPVKLTQESGGYITLLLQTFKRP